MSEELTLEKFWEQNSYCPYSQIECYEKACKASFLNEKTGKYECQFVKLGIPPKTN